MRNVPLDVAVIALCPATSAPPAASEDMPSAVAVFALGDSRADQYPITTGACEAHWRERPDQQWPKLLHLFWHMVRGFGLDVAAVDLALSAIPEYREMSAAP